MLLNTLEYVGNLLKQSNDTDDINRIKNVFKILSKKKDDNEYINYDDLKKEINFDNFKKLDNENEDKFNKYKFDTDDDIIKSFKKIFREKQISYKPYSKSKHKIKDLLDKMEYHEKLPKDLFEYFNTELSEKLEHKIPIDKIISKQDGKGYLILIKLK